MNTIVHLRGAKRAAPDSLPIGLEDVGPADAPDEATAVEISPIDLEATADALRDQLAGEAFDRQAPEAEIARLADMHRGDAGRIAARMASTRRALKSRIAALDAAVEAERARHRAELARLDAEHKALSGKAHADLEADRRLAAYHAGALELLEGERP